MASLSEIALKIEECKKSIEKIEKFKEQCKMRGYYIALIEDRCNDWRGEHIIHRFHDIEARIKTLVIKECDKAIKKQNDEILELEKEILKNTIESVAEDSQLPKKEKKNFFNKLFKE